MKSLIISSSKPRSIAVADLNNDHQLDIVVANSGTNTVGIFLSKEDGTYGEPAIYPTHGQSHPRSITIYDFNNDSYLDIAVANYATNNIEIFFGARNGTFINQKIFSLGSSHPLFITIGDVNKDKQMDIIVANDGTNTVGILFGNGDGSFQDQVTFFAGYDSMPCSLTVSDLNNDNHLDIAIANYGTDNIGILLGYGNGSFTSAETYTTLPQSNPSSLAVGDFNNDNHLDIVVANSGTGNVGIFLGYGNGTFFAQRTYSIGNNTHPQFVSVGDFNKDNELDIVVLDSVNDRVHILRGHGHGIFATRTTYDATSKSNPLWAAVADFNSSSKQSDIFIVNYGTDEILLLSNYSVKPSTRQTNFDGGPPSSTASVAASDFNDDHIYDIVFTAADGIMILLGVGDGTFTEKTVYSTGPASNPQYVCVGDLNNDGQMDIVVAAKRSNSVVVFLGYGNGTFAPMITYSTGIGSEPWWLALGDANHDNRLDVISANTGTKTIGILLGNDDGTLAAMISYPTGLKSAPRSVAAEDINNDNYLDILVLNADSTIDIFLGHRDGTLNITATFETGQGSNPVSFTVADLNSDNYTDIVVANTFNHNIGVFLGNGDGTFAAQTIYSTGFTSQPYCIAVADVNHDKIADILVTDLSNDLVLIFYGSGNGTFELRRSYSTGLGSKPDGIITADLNNDQQLEIVVVLWGTGDVAVLTEYEAADFTYQKTYSTGPALQSFSVAVNDFNNDNKSDIVVSNSGADTLGIYFGSNSGEFMKKLFYPIGIDSQPQYVITCDINNDNRVDIISVNSKMNSISVIIGNGSGNFAEQMIFSTGTDSRPYAIASGDFNNDNRLDFVVANRDTDDIGILLGFDYASFQNQEPYSIDDNQGPTRIATDDFNHDTFLDIAIVFLYSDSLGILLGYGNGSFMTMISYSLGNGSGPFGIAVGDLNNDGHLDIVTANSGTDNVGILLGYGSGSFATMMVFSTGTSSVPGYVAVGDLNNDNHLDIVVTNLGSNTLGVLLGSGNGTFVRVQSYSTGKDSTPYAVAIGDINHDGQMDVAVILLTLSYVSLFLGNGNGTFKSRMTFSMGYYCSPLSIVIADLNNDLRFDLAITCYGANAVRILFGYKNGTFADISYSTGAGSTPRDLRVGDFNNDNIVDIAVTNYGINSIVILFGFGDGTFLLGKASSTGAQSYPFSLAIGDFNNDTQLDIIVANYRSNNIGVLLGNGSQLLAGVTTYTTGHQSQPHSVAVGDFNNDGRLDIVVANYGNDNVGILLGYGNGFFDTMKTYFTGTGSAPYSVAVADLNDDQQLDIVVSNSQTDNLAILLGFGNGTFAIGAKHSTGTLSRPYTVAIGDLNNDNTMDLVVANSGTSIILLLYGYGNGTFGNNELYRLGYGYHPYSVAIKDLNQDNWLDIVIACYDTDHIEILMRIC